MASLRPWSQARATTLPRDLDHVAHGLWLEAAALIEARLATVIHDLRDLVADTGIDLRLPVAGDVPAFTPLPARDVDDLDDPVNTGLVGALNSYGSAASIAFGADRLLTLLSPLLGPVGLGIGAAIGLAGATARRRGARTIRELGSAQRLVQRTITEARGRASRELNTYVIDLQHQVEKHINGQLTAADTKSITPSTKDGRQPANQLQTEIGSAQQPRRDSLGSQHFARARRRSQANAVSRSVDAVTTARSGSCGGWRLSLSRWGWHGLSR